MRRELTFFLQTVLIVVMCWLPLNLFVLGFDGAGRIPLTLLIVSCFIISPFISKEIRKKPICIYIILALYMFVNVIWKGTHIAAINSTTYSVFCKIFNPIFLFFIVAYLARINYDRTLIVCLTGLLLYTILCLVSDTSSQYEGRIGSEINPNTIALNASLSYLLAFYLYVRDKISRLTLIILALIPLYAILATGSRMAFIIVVAPTFFYMIFLQKRKKDSVLGLIVFLLLFFIGLTYVLNNTYIGERLLSTTTQIEGTEIETGNRFIDAFGDRGVQYYNSFPLFLDNFITGIGLNHWVEYNPTGHVCHSEYLTMYLENGVIGIILYLSFFLYFFRKLKYIYKSKTSSEKSSYYLLCVFWGLAAINFVFWTYDSYGFFVFYALTYSFISNNESKIKNAIAK